MDKPTNILDSSKAPIHVSFGDLGDAVQKICKVLELLPPSLQTRVIKMVITLMNIDLGHRTPPNSSETL